MSSLSLMPHSHESISHDSTAAVCHIAALWLLNECAAILRSIRSMTRVCRAMDCRMVPEISKQHLPEVHTPPYNVLL